MRRVDRIGRITFVVLLGLSLLALGWVMHPFFVPVLLGAVLAVLLRPSYERMLARMPARPGMAALLTTLAVFLLLLVPLSLLAFAVARELGEALPALVGLAEEIALREGSAEARWRRAFPESIGHLIPQSSEIAVRIGHSLSGLARELIGGIAGVASGLLLNGFLTFVSTYYFFLDGQRLAEKSLKMLPLDDRYERELFHQFRDTSVAVIYGNGVVGLVQGTLLFVAFLVTGVESAIVWACLTVVMAFVPLLGTGLVWAPAGILLLATGKTWQGVFFLLWGALVVSTVDNVLRPLLVKDRIRVHPLVVFLAIFGGIATFGAIGALLGPLVASLTMALLRIWEVDFVEARSGVIAPVPPSETPLALLQHPPKRRPV